MRAVLVVLMLIVLGAGLASGLVLYPMYVGNNSGTSLIESLELTNQHVWFDSKGWAEAAVAVVNIGERDVVLSKITVKGVESKWSDVYYWETNTGPVSEELQKTSAELTGSTFEISVDGQQRTFQQATSGPVLVSGWTAVLYARNPGNLTASDVGHEATIAVFSQTRLYFKETNVEGGGQTQQAGAVLSEANTRFYFVPDPNLFYVNTPYIGVTLLNSGTADARITQVYLGTSAANLADVTGGVVFTPDTKIVKANGGSINATWSYQWESGQRYYFKFVTEASQQVPFDCVAP